MTTSCYWILLQRDEAGGETTIIGLRPDGTAKSELLTLRNHQLHEFVMERQGTRAAMIMAKPGQNPDLYVADMKTGRVARMTATRVSETRTSWHPRGDGLLVSRVDYDNPGSPPELYAVDLPARDSTRIGTGYQASWSPDGSTIAFTDLHSTTLSPNLPPAGISLRDDLGTHAATSGEKQVDLRAVWAPDGRSLYFTREEAVPEWLDNASVYPNLMKYSLDSLETQRITSFDGVSEGLTSFDVGHDGELAYGVTTHGEHERIQVEGDQPDPLIPQRSSADNPMWGPDGSLFFEVFTKGRWELWNADEQGNSRPVSSDSISRLLGFWDPLKSLDKSDSGTTDSYARECH